VGFDHDAEYLGFFAKKLFPLVSAAPPDLARCRDMHEFKTKTLVALLGDENLRLISIWSPTFLTTLLDDYQARREEILNALRRSGRVDACRRADLLRHMPESVRQISFEEVWTKLQVISCWTHGPSEIYAENLRSMFPNVEMQGKGLVATEAFVSLPFHESRDPALAFTSHFFEFQDVAEETIFLAHELAPGRTYRVIVTTGGGLYRYSMGDLVRVTGLIEDAPCLRFIGREGNVSDLFGEKLQGVFVEGVIRRALAQQDIKPRFFLLAPVAAAAAAPAYAIFLQADSILDAPALQRSLEEGLTENFQYKHCRHLGQLAEARVFLINRGERPSEAVFQQQMLSRGIKLGDIKMGILDCRSNWEQHFSGSFVS